MRAPGLSLLAALVSLAVVTGASAASGSPQTRAALDALARGDNETAARLFTEILLYGAPSRVDRELAYAKRAEAFMALGRSGDAAADARRALALDPRDAEAQAVRDKAAAATPTATMAPKAIAAASAEPSDVLNAKIKANLDAVESRNKAAFDKYQADVAAYEAQKAVIAAKAKADQDAYAAGLGAHDAQVRALADQQAAAMAAWRRRVADCARGVYSQCGH